MRGWRGVDTQLRREGIAPTSELAPAQSLRILDHFFFVFLFFCF